MVFGRSHAWHLRSVKYCISTECPIDEIGDFWMSGDIEIGFHRDEEFPGRIRVLTENCLTSNDYQILISSDVGSGTNNMLKFVASHRSLPVLLR